MADEGCSCDVYSPGELSIALQAGFDPALISVNGVPKDEDHICRCVREGVRITIDSVEELDIIEQASDSLGKIAQVRMRLEPAISGFISHTDFMADGYVPTDIAALDYKGGLTYDDIVALGHRIPDADTVELVGLYEHSGRHHRSTRFCTIMHSPTRRTRRWWTRPISSDAVVMETG